MDHIPTTPEEAQALHERNMMRAQAERHKLLNWLSSLDQEGLEGLRATLEFVVFGSPRKNAMHLLGMVAARLEDRHNICPTCQVDHQAEMIDGEKITLDPGPSPHPEDPGASLDNNLGSTDDVIRLMEEYGVEVDERPDAPLPYRCKGCGVGVHSMTDRMRRPPGIDGCSGCQIKSAHG